MSSDEEFYHDDDENSNDSAENPEAQKATGNEGSSGGFSVVNFLMGNIDEQGKLIKDEVIDDDVVKALDSSFAASSIRDLDSTKSVGSIVAGSSTQSPEPVDKDYDYTAKNEDAIDFSENANIGDDADLFDEMNNDLKNSTAAADDNKQNNGLKDDYDEEDDVAGDEQSKAPSTVTAESKADTEKESSTSDSKKDSDGFAIPTLPSQTPAPEPPRELKLEPMREIRKLDTPLGAMLPSKYADADVTDLFPEFRPNKVLRFSRLFQRNKKGVLPQIWRGHRVPRKNKQALEQQLSEDAPQTNGHVVWKFQYPDDDEIDLRDLIQEDAEYTLLKNEKLESDFKKDQGSGEIPDWRHSASKYWYDKYKIAENGENFDYGFKLRPRNDDGDDDDEEDNDEPPAEQKQLDADDVFHLVTQTCWEDDIIWDCDIVRQQVLARCEDKNLPSGWLPSGMNRTASQFTNMRPNTSAMKPTTSSALKKTDKKGLGDKNSAEAAENTWWSIFPVENEELVNGNWEDDIIWDAENMDRIPEPKLVVLDRNDENVILDIPIDEAPDSTVDPTVKRKEKPTGIRKSRLLLGKAGVIAEPELIQPPSPPSTEKDPFNISNDEYYADKTTPQQQIKTSVAGNLIQHSIPAIELRPQFFPTFLNYQKLRDFHRPALKRYSYGAIADTAAHGVEPLLRYIKKKARERETHRIESGGGEMFFMRTPEDLTGKDGDLILAEFSEEFPPLMMQIGMATKIKNFYRRKHGKDNGPPPLKFGEMAYCSTSPFLGLLAPGQCLQAFENNMVRAPIYEHQVPESDFLVIRTRDSYYVREVETIYTVGQELPLMEVPGPNSKKSNNFIRDFLQVFIYRLFWKSTDVPRRIKMDDIKRAFPSHSESSIRKRLKQCADFKRTGMDSNWWVIKSDFRLPSEDEIRAMVSPEACCAYYSMLAAEQRLKDGGYGEKYMFAEEGDDVDNQSKIEDEVKAAPWHTTRAFCSAMKSKCLLQLTGVADPTGCGEGFSYIRIPNKPTQTKEEMAKNPVPKKIVSGTEADLRKLPLEKAKEMLRSYGFSEEEMKKLSRWEIIDVVRTYSTKKAKETEENEGDGFVNKFARGNRFSIAEHQERYKEECQRIFDLQNKVLASKEDLSTDEDESDDEEDSELEEMGKNIESLLTQKKTVNQMTRDIEEEERKELKKMLMGDKGKKGDDKQQLEDDKGFGVGGKVLKIHRTYVTPEGQEYIRIETVRKPAVIDTYVKIRSSKDENYIKQFTTALDDQQKEEKRKEKRRLQEQLRRMKRNQEREKLQKSLKSSYGFDMPDKPVKEKPLTARELAKIEKKRIREEKIRQKELAKLNSNSKCSACGGNGHYRNNKSCPLYQADETSMDTSSVQFQEDNLVKVDETKVVINKAILNKYEDQAQAAEARKSLKTSRTNSKDSNTHTPGVRGRKRKSVVPTGDNMEYLAKPEYRAHNRRRVDPLVVLCEIFDECITEMKTLPNTKLFHTPVNVKDVPDYYNIIKEPMDLQTMRENVRKKAYKDRESFLKHLSMIHSNCLLYNGPLNLLSTTAEHMVAVCANKLLEREEEILKLEKLINPIRHESDLVAFCYVLKTIVTERLKTIPDSWPFRTPVGKNVLNYFEIIKHPMDLETIELNLDAHHYKSRAQFMKDIELIYENSVKYNGKDSPLTAKALEIVDKAKAELADPQIEPQLAEWEAGIRAQYREAGFEDFDETSRMSEESDLEPSAKRPHTETDGANIADDLQISDEDDADDDNDDVFEQPTQPIDEQFYQAEASNDGFDPNYDPSELFLNAGFGQMAQPSGSGEQQAAAGDELDAESAPASQGEETGLEQDLDLSASSNDDDDNDDNDDEDDDAIWF